MTQRQLLGIALRDLRDGARGLWVLCASLALGVTLVAASAGLHQQVNGALEADARALLGGDVKVQSRTPLARTVAEADTVIFSCKRERPTARCRPRDDRSKAT